MYSSINLIQFNIFLIGLQAYLLEGITRWNAARASAAKKEKAASRSFDLRLQDRVCSHSARVNLIFRQCTFHCELYAF